MQCPDRTTNLTRGHFSSPPEGFFRTTSPAGGFRFIQQKFPQAEPAGISKKRISKQGFPNKIYCILPERKTSIILNGQAVPDFKCSAKKKTASAVPSA